MNRRTFIKLTGIATVAGLTTVPTSSAPKQQWTRLTDSLPKVGKRIAFADYSHPEYFDPDNTNFCMHVGHRTNERHTTIDQFPLNSEFFGISNRRGLPTKNTMVITENMMTDYNDKDWQRFKRIREQAATMTVGGDRIFANRKMRSYRFKDNDTTSHITVCTLHDNMWWMYIDDNSTINIPHLPKPIMRKN